MKRWTWLIALVVGLMGIGTANAATTTAWIVPAGLSCPQTCRPGDLTAEHPGHSHIGLDTGVWRSEGYDPGTSWPTLAFGCPGQNYVWRGEDDDDTGGGVKFGSVVQLSGIRYQTLGWSGYPHPYPHRGDFDASVDGVNWVRVAAVRATIPFNTWTTVQATFAPTNALYLRWFMEDDGSFVNALNMRVLAPSTTAKAC